ncbi:acetamidase/formamidase family protein [Nocardioides sp. Leaf374]|uniref:acetamidase/formamidase family protein n=1 Tax=Nocardioides sp. Leaf374 TaxID=2876560 RepID=UPI001E51EA08|nr:acetamidase/formamidase family protein [Nocardioides sp. Leaf374]
MTTSGTPDQLSSLARRALLRGAAAGAVGAGALGATGAPAGASPGRRAPAGGPHGPVRVLQPGTGPTRGRYVRARAEEVLWGRLPNRLSEPVAVVSSGDVVTLDTLSHEGLLEDQGQDPREYFGSFGVPERHVLRDAVEVAAHTPHDGPGPHVVTGPVAVRGAEPGDVLRVDVLDLPLRVPYGVVSNRHGKGALPGEYPERFVGDPAHAAYVNEGGNISVFTEVVRSRGGLRGRLPGDVPVGFDLHPFLGMMGVARDTTALVDSVPPTYAGGNIDINDLTVGSTLYLPVQVAGAMFFAGDPHMAQGDGEVALTAMEGSLRPTLRLSVVKRGSRGAPAQAFEQPFAENRDFWIPIGLSDPDGPEGGGNATSLDLAMKDAVRQALAFLVEERGMAGPVAYAYLSAAADFQCSQVVDRTTGIHALIRKADFA